MEFRVGWARTRRRASCPRIAQLPPQRISPVAVEVGECVARAAQVRIREERAVLPRRTGRATVGRRVALRRIARANGDTVRRLQIRGVRAEKNLRGRRARFMRTDVHHQPVRRTGNWNQREQP